MMKFSKILTFFSNIPMFSNNSSLLTVGNVQTDPVQIVLPYNTEILCDGSLTISSKGHLFLQSDIASGKKILLNTMKDENGEPILEDDFNASAEYDHEHETVDELAEEIETLRGMVTSLKERIEYLERKAR